MALDVNSYSGREQAYVKHYFLSNYLERLIHKTAYRFEHIVYIDGFSGPWQSSGENYDDTSFGIALKALRAAKVSWAAQGRSVKMSAHLVEKSRSSFQRLAEVPARYPDLEVIPHHASFLDVVDHIVRSVPRDAFVFTFIDPKGWRIPLQRLSSLLSRPNSEVLFNFMFDFINRAASMTDPQIVLGLDELIPAGDWRAKLSSLKSAPAAEAPPDARKAILIEAFSEALSRLGDYPYVAETPILRPLADRTLYSLIYSTRKPAGIEVFRDCQIKALKEQSQLRGTKKIEAQQASSQQGEMFGSLTELAPDETATFLEKEHVLATEMLLRLVPPSPETVPYGTIWPQLLAKHAVRRTDIGRLVADLRKEGVLEVKPWPDRKRIPDDTFHLSRPLNPRPSSGRR